MTMKYWLGAGIAVAAGVGLYAFQAKAADLGGNCCADLEERVAELEATTARKGNRKVTLTISGHVAHNVMHWDDGAMSDTYIGDGGMNASRFRFTGAAKISPDLTAGFTYEFGINNNALGSMDQTVGGDDLGGAVSLRDSTVYLEHKMLGKVKLGHGSTATDNLVLLDISNAKVAASSDVALFNGGFFLRHGIGAGGYTPLTWSNILNQGVSFDTARRNHVSYQSASLAGFMVEAAVAENDFWDVALKYAGEFSGIRVAAAVGYSVDEDAAAFHTIGGLLPTGIPATEIKNLTAAVSVKHMTSGLFVTASGAQRETGFSISAPGVSLSAKDSQMWHVIAGWEKNVFGPGLTTLYGEYHNADDMIGFSTVGLAGIDVSSKANVVGFGVVQSIDAAAMDIFLSYKRYSGDVDLKTSVPGIGGSLGVQDFTAIIGGAKISF